MQNKYISGLCHSTCEKYIERDIYATIHDYFFERYSSILAFFFEDSSSAYTLSFNSPTIIFKTFFTALHKWLVYAGTFVQGLVKFNNNGNFHSSEKFHPENRTIPDWCHKVRPSLYTIKIFYFHVQWMNQWIFIWSAYTPLW